MRKVTSAVFIVTAGLFTINLAAQAPPTPAPQQPAAQAPAAEAAPAAAANPDAIKIVGCLREEKDVAGLKPNVVERAGITEDYILTMVKSAPDSKVSGLGLGTMYEVEGIAEGELKKHLNHQVEVLGKIEAGPAGARNRDDVPDFRATSIRMLAATCPAPAQ
jgi:hypothetical protein